MRWQWFSVEPPLANRLIGTDCARCWGSKGTVHTSRGEPTRVCQFQVSRVGVPALCSDPKYFAGLRVLWFNLGTLERDFANADVIPGSSTLLVTVISLHCLALSLYVSTQLSAQIAEMTVQIPSVQHTKITFPFGFRALNSNPSPFLDLAVCPSCAFYCFRACCHRFFHQQSEKCLLLMTGRLSIECGESAPPPPPFDRQADVQEQIVRTTEAAHNP